MKITKNKTIAFLIIFGISMFMVETSNAMEISRAFYKCRPQATFIHGANFASLNMANSRYDGDDKVTQAELDACWADTQIEDTIAEKTEATEILAGEKVDALMPTSSVRRKLKAASRATKLVLKKVKGTISANEETELDTLSDLSDQIDEIYDAADLIFGEIELDPNYDYVNSPHWP